MTEIKQSSEEKEQVLAQEALDAANAEETPAAEEPVVKEPAVPLHEHTALRQRAQQAEVDKARLEGELAGMKTQQASNAPAVISPYDAEVARQEAEGIGEEDMKFTPKILRAQDAYNKQVANQEATATAKQQMLNQQVASANKAKTEHEDWQATISAGQALLTPGELLDLEQTGVDFGEVAYEKCQTAIARSAKTEPDNTAPNKKDDKKSESEAEKKAAAEKVAAEKAKVVPTQQEILDVVGQVDPQTAHAATL